MPTATLPDTLYLPDRAKLAINCLVGCLNPDKHQLPFCLTDLTGSPPRMAHTQFDYSDHTARVIDGLLSAQAMTGSNEGDNQLSELEEQFFSGFGDDGLQPHPKRSTILWTPSRTSCARKNCLPAGVCQEHNCPQFDQSDDHGDWQSCTCSGRPGDAQSVELGKNFNAAAVPPIADPTAFCSQEHNGDFADDLAT